ncbi:hypothetical protein NS263_11640 [Curtobacterium oceanosedimentum]|uniref:Lipoprotein n=1 Tax=Curtobacterium oceanosedimentum TaxID=465820 RepID=A0ABR5S4M1_9MICO|nr:hypothetical protein [Curtobacterium oceanosedimentum]KTR39060.1 hypothetical protein NS263_11640 [Curtobacterium oceanosedimentum]
MITVRRALAAVVVVLGAAGLTACTTGQPEPEDSLDTAARSEVSATGSAPIVFAFVCSGAADGSTDSGDEPSDDPDGTAETYTTYAAVWEAERADCRAERITGTEMSAQQRAAVRATDGAATLEELAATCAERGASPWRDGVSTPEQADLAAGLVAYCPGHPDRDRLQDALTAYRG